MHGVGSELGVAIRNCGRGDVIVCFICRDKGLSCHPENTKQNIISFGRVWIGQI